MKHAQRNRDWLFIKGYNLKYSERHGVLTIRLITVVGVLMILTSGILWMIGQLGVGK